MTSLMPAGRRKGSVGPRNRRVRVLLVDDSPAARGLLQLILEAAGVFEVVAEAADVNGAVSLSYRADLAVVMMDGDQSEGSVQLSGLRRGCAALRIAVLTTTRDLWDPPMVAGADLYLDKCSPPSDLVAELAALTGVRADRRSDYANAAWAAQIRGERGRWGQSGRWGEGGLDAGAAFDQAAIGMALTGFDGRPVRVNRALCRLLGRTPDELMGASLWHWAHPDHEVTPPPAPDDLMKSPPTRFERCWSRPDGGPMRVVIDAAVVSDDQGRPRYLVCQVHDVAAAGAADGGLRASEATFRNAWEGAASGMALVSPAGACLRVNRRLCAMTGYREQDLVGHGLDALTHPLDTDIGIDQMTACLQGRRDRYQYDTRWIRKDGSILWIMISGTVVRDINANPSYVAVEVHDLTERRLTQDALAAGEERYRSLVAALDEGVVLQDHHQRILACNASAERILAVSAQDLVGQIPPDLSFSGICEDGSLLAPEDHPARLALRSKRVERGIIGLTVGGGQFKWLSITASPVGGHGDSTQGVVVSFTDVTATRDAALALEESEARFRLLADNASDLIAVVDPDSRYRYVSPSCRAILGYEPEEMIGHPSGEHWHPEDLDRIAAMPSKAEVTTFTGRVRAKDGHWVWLEVNRRRIVDWATGRVTEYQTAARDVTDRRAAEDALASEREFLAALLVNLADGIVACDADGKLTLVNRSAEELYGPGADRAAIEGWAGGEGLFAADGRTPLGAGESPLARALSGEFVRNVEIVVAPPAQSARHILASGQPIVDPHGTRLGAVVALHDVTDRKLLEARLTDLAMHDGLTGLANRVLLLDRLEHALARRDSAGNTLAVLFLDLDRFKAVNDTFGHAAGDAVLKAVAGRLRETVRPADTAARLGGDEFVVVCEDLASENEAVVVAERIEAALSEPHLVGGNDLVVTVSVGIVFALEAVPVDVLLHRADAAMYEAKQRGRAQHRIFRDPGRPMPPEG